MSAPRPSIVRRPAALRRTVPTLVAVLALLAALLATAPGAVATPEPSASLAYGSFPLANVSPGLS